MKGSRRALKSIIFCNCSATWVHIRYGYKELVRVPVGPKEPGCIFYPEYKTEITVLGAVVTYQNAEGVRETHYHTMVTDVIEHCPATTIVFLRKILEHVPRHCKTLDLWQDAGNHFRAYEVLCFQLGDIFDEHGDIDDVWVNGDPEHHGKGPCDAHFGILRHWMDMYSSEHMIADHIGLVEAYKAGAAASHAFDPPPVGPRHHVHLVEMGSRPEKLRTIDASKMDGLSVSNTYCLRGKRVAHTCSGRSPGCLADIQVQDYVFSDERAPLRTWSRRYVENYKGTEGWRVYKAPKNVRDMSYKSVIPKLKARFEKQRRCARTDLATQRRRPQDAAEAAYEHKLRQKRVKQNV